MEARVVAAGRGWQWLVDGFALFRRAPLMWLALTAQLALMWLVSLVIPLLGPLLFNLFFPAFYAGLMAGCRAVENGEPLEFRHLFVGLRQQAVPLVTVGGVYLAGTIIVMGIVLIAAGGSMLPTILEKGAGADIETLRAGLRSLALALAIGAAAYLPLMMLVWFAPPLVLFEGMAPFDAMKLSFAACIRNTMPFLVYGLAILGVWMVLSVPAAVLGPAGAVLAFALLAASLPVLIASVYASYQDIFPAPRAAPAGGDNPFLR